MSWSCSEHGDFRAEELSKDLVTSSGNVMCPECGNIMANNGDEDKDDIPEIEDPGRGGSNSAPRTDSKRQVELSAEDMMLAKKMIKTGLGADLNDVTQRALRYYGGANFNSVFHANQDMMNEKLIEMMNDNSGEGMFEKAMAISMLNGSLGGAAQQQQKNDGMDMQDIMMMNMLSNNEKQSKEPQSNGGQGMDPMAMMLMMQDKGSDDGLDTKELIQLLQDQDSGGGGMDPMTLMMMQNDDSGQDDAYKELLQRFEEQRREQTQMQEKLLEEKFGNELDKMNQQMQAVAQKADEAEQSDMNELLEQMEQVEKFATKLGMTAGDGGENDSANLQRLVDTIGEHMGPAMEKFAESQVGGGTNRSVSPAAGGGQPSRQKDIQQARADVSSSESTSSPEPTPSDVKF